MDKKTADKILVAASGIFKKSGVGLPIYLKVKVAELILGLMARKKSFGLFVILGWQNKWRKFTDISDSTQDIFARHHHNVMSIGERSGNHHNLAATLNFDGAILINARGDITHSGVTIEGLRPSLVARKINPGRFRDLSEQFGFKKKVHTRHLSAIAASYFFEDTTVFTVSEETDAFHVFENGRIIYSTVTEEPGQNHPSGIKYAV